VKRREDTDIIVSVSLLFYFSMFQPPWNCTFYSTMNKYYTTLLQKNKDKALYGKYYLNSAATEKITYLFPHII
jgi:hypothetical protein